MSARELAIDALVRKLDEELGEDGYLRKHLDEQLLAHGFPRLDRVHEDDTVPVYVVEPPVGEGDESWLSRLELRIYLREDLDDTLADSPVRIELRHVPVEEFLRTVAAWES